MQNELHIQIKMALSAMVSQGEKALEYFVSNQFKLGMDLLKEREFSFYNFRYADLALLKKGVNVAEDMGIKEELNKLFKINGELVKYFSSEKKKQGASLNSIKFSAPAFKGTQNRQVKKFNFNIGI